MSHSKGAIRRVALFSSSTFVAAGIAAAASLGAAFTPGAALAQVCSQTQADVNDAAADVVTCAAGTYASGIQYTAVGDLDLTVQTGSNFGTGGVVTNAGVSASDPDDLIVRLQGTVTTSGSTQFNTALPRLIDAQSQAGDVTVDFNVGRSSGGSFISIQANNAATTHFIYAVSHAGGDVRVTSTSFTGSAGSQPNVAFQATGASSIAAIEARSVGGGDVTIGVGGTGNLQVSGGQHGIWAQTDGAGSIDVALGTASNPGSTQGRLYGIRAQASGTGSLTFTGSASASTANGYGIHATTGTGLLTINGSGTASAAGGIGAYISAGGDVVYTGSATGNAYGIYLADVKAGTTSTVNLTSNATGGTAGIFAQGDGELIVHVVNSISSLNFNFNGMAAPVSVDFSDNAAWSVSSSTTVPSGNFSIDIAADSGLTATAPLSQNALETPITITFADPATVLANAGAIVVGSDSNSTSWQPALQEAELRIVGLGEFRNSGTILLGGAGYPGLGSQRTVQGVKVEQTDSWYDDMLVFQNGVWISDGGKVIFDVDTNRTQLACTRNATFDFPAADCLRIVDSTVEGTTYVDVREILPGDRGRLTQQIMDEGILLIDAPGSTVTAENFVLDPTMDSYNPDTESLDKGLFQYVFLFDEDASQFRLVGTLSGAAYELPIAATAGHNLWRLSTGSWFERQADLRGGVDAGLGGGVWLRALGEQVDRDVINTSTLAGQQFSVDSTHEGATYAINGGVDLISGDDGDMAYVFGFMAGYGHTDIEYAASANTQAMDAWSGGVYGSVVAGPLYVDAVVNANNVIIDTDAPGFGFQPAGTILSSRMLSLGGQVEAGYRFALGQGMFAEPLASVAYVRSTMDDLEIRPDDQSRPGLEVSFEDPSSLRAGVGGRVGIDQRYAGMQTQVSLLGRVWNDLEGQNTAAIHNLAFPNDPEIRVLDDFSGMFSELAIGANVWSPNGAVSGFVNLGGKFSDDYEAKTGSVGIRARW